MEQFKKNLKKFKKFLKDRGAKTLSRELKLVDLGDDVVLSGARVTLNVIKAPDKPYEVQLFHILATQNIFDKLSEGLYAFLCEKHLEFERLVEDFNIANEFSNEDCEFISLCPFEEGHFDENGFQSKDNIVKESNDELKITAILIDPTECTVKEIKLSKENTLDEMYMYMKCNRIQYAGSVCENVVYVDEAGMLKDDLSGFQLRGLANAYPFVGKAIIMNRTAEGDSESTSLEVDEVLNNIFFFG